MLGRIRWFAFSIVLFAACGGSGGNAVPASPRATRAATATRVPANALPLPFRIWPTAAAANAAAWAGGAEPQCDNLATPRVVREDIAPMVSIGPVHLTAPRNPVRVGPPYYFSFVLAIDNWAGQQVRIKTREQATRVQWYFFVGSTDGPVTLSPDTPEDGAPALTIRGPFDVKNDAVRGYIFAPVPGCYSVQVEWAGGSAEGVVGIAPR